MIRGCSSRVYAIVDPEEEVHYKKLLGKGMISGHAWRTEENLDAVRRLVPLWAGGEASSGWLESDVDGSNKKRKWG